MKKSKLNKFIVSSVIAVSVLSVSPSVVKADWVKDSVGWRYYIDDANYHIGWQQINGNWYYFYRGGYMAHDVVIDDCYLNSYGAWSDVSTTPGGNEWDKDANGVEDFLEKFTIGLRRDITPEMRSDPNKKLSSGVTLGQARGKINDTIRQMAGTEKDVSKIQIKILAQAEELGTTLEDIGYLPPAGIDLWKQDYKGWWYVEGDSYAIGWRYIDNEWYYFHENGYMAHDEAITVKWYVASDGHWNRKDYSVKYVKRPGSDPYSLDFIKIIINDDGTETIVDDTYFPRSDQQIQETAVQETPKNEGKPATNAANIIQPPVPISKYLADYPALNRRSDLNLNNKNIGDLTALKDYTNLTYVYIQSNQISDISALKEFKNLIQLDANNNKINDISPLKNLTNLKQLSIGSNTFEDMSALSNLTNLTDLAIGFGKLSDLSSLKPLVNLMTLNLNGNEIKDISVLSDMTKLKTLHLQVNKLSDISALKNLVNLETLMLSGNNISDLSPLKDLVNLITLDIGGNPISDITALKSLKNLSTLYLQGIKLNDSDLKALQEALPNCKIVTRL